MVSSVGMRGLALLSRRWAPEIMLTLSVEGPCRFNKLLAIYRIATVISDRVLTERLRELELAGLVSREVRVEPGTSVSVTYELTDKARPYIEPLRGLAAL